MNPVDMRNITHEEFLSIWDSRPKLNNMFDEFKEKKGSLELPEMIILVKTSALIRQAFLSYTFPSPKKHRVFENEIMNDATMETLLKLYRALHEKSVTTIIVYNLAHSNVDVEKDFQLLNGNFTAYKSKLGCAIRVTTSQDSRVNVGNKVIHDKNREEKSPAFGSFNKYLASTITANNLDVGNKNKVKISPLIRDLNDWNSGSLTTCASLVTNKINKRSMLSLDDNDLRDLIQECYEEDTANIVVPLLREGPKVLRTTVQGMFTKTKTSAIGRPKIIERNYSDKTYFSALSMLTRRKIMPRVTNSVDGVYMTAKDRELFSFYLDIESIVSTGAYKVILIEETDARKVDMLRHVLDLYENCLIVCKTNSQSARKEINSRISYEGEKITAFSESYLMLIDKFASFPEFAEELSVCVVVMDVNTDFPSLIAQRKDYDASDSQRAVAGALRTVAYKFGSAGASRDCIMKRYMGSVPPGFTDTKRSVKSLTLSATSVFGHALFLFSTSDEILTFTPISEYTVIQDYVFKCMSHALDYLSCLIPLLTIGEANITPAHKLKMEKVAMLIPHLEYGFEYNFGTSGSLDHANYNEDDFEDILDDPEDPDNRSEESFEEMSGDEEVFGTSGFEVKDDPPQEKRPSRNLGKSGFKVKSNPPQEKQEVKDDPPQEKLPTRTPGKSVYKVKRNPIQEKEVKDDPL